jgi:hypothetical protein
MPARLNSIIRVKVSLLIFVIRTQPSTDVAVHNVVASSPIFAMRTSCKMNPGIFMHTVFVDPVHMLRLPQSSYGLFRER